MGVWHPWKIQDLLPLLYKYSLGSCPVPSRIVGTGDTRVSESNASLLPALREERSITRYPHRQMCNCPVTAALGRSVVLEGGAKD